MPLTLTQVIWVQFLLTLLPSLGVGTEKIFADEKHHRPTLFSASRFLSKTTPMDIICRSVTISLMTIIPFLFLLWNSPASSDALGISTLLRGCIFHFKFNRSKCIEYLGSAYSRMYHAHFYAIDHMLANAAVSMGIAFSKDVREYSTFCYPSYCYWAASDCYLC